MRRAILLATMVAACRSILALAPVAASCELSQGTDGIADLPGETPPEEEWLTFYEESGYEMTPRYEETISYCRRLAEASPWVHFTSLGTSPQGRTIPLLVVDKRSRFEPSGSRDDRAVILVQACIHAGECDGKDAGLMLVRDIAVTKELAGILDHVTLLFIPILNVDGHERFGPYNRINQNGPREMGWRVTAQNLNLNRDYLKVDSPEMRAWLELFNSWLPDFFVDCHVTDGADYSYVLTYALDLFGTMEKGLERWIRESYLQDIEQAMQREGFPIFPYVNFRKRHVPESGLVSWITPPRLSHGYATIQNRPGLLIETHMLKDYKTRVDATYAMLKNTIKIVSTGYATLLRAVREADRFTASPRFRETPFALLFEQTGDSVMIDFLGVRYEMEKSDLSGGTWIRWGKELQNYRIPYFNRYKPKLAIRLPVAYIVPPEWTEVIERIRAHGISFYRVSRQVTVRVSSYRFLDVKWQEKPYEGRHMLRYRVEPIEEVRSFPEGSIVIKLSQRAARVAVHLLEPQAPDALAKWGFFDTIFEQKEYAEDYVMEELARRMLRNNRALREEFEEKRSSDKAFADNPRAILNWFYTRTPYWDDRMGIYPVGRIMSEEELAGLPLAR